MSYKVYNPKLYEDFNTNSTASVTESLHIEPSSLAVVYVIPKTGSNNVHIVQVEVSPDDVNWQEEPNANVTGADKHVEVDVKGHKFMRVKCSKAEGTASTVDIYINPMEEI